MFQDFNVINNIQVPINKYFNFSIKICIILAPYTIFFMSKQELNVFPILAMNTIEIISKLYRVVVVECLMEFVNFDIKQDYVQILKGYEQANNFEKLLFKAMFTKLFKIKIKMN